MIRPFMDKGLIGKEPVDSPLIVILLDSSQLGGIETHVYHLSRALRRSGWSAEIWFYRQYPEQHPLEPRLTTEQIRFRYLRGTVKHLLSELKTCAPLVLHTHGYKAGIFGRFTARISRTPVISTFHNGDPGEGIVRLYTWLDRITSAWSKNIAVSADIARRFKHPPLQVNNFIDVPKIDVPKRAPSERMAKPDGAVAFVGRLSFEKGPDRFLQLAKHQPALRFCLYGTGPMQDNLRQQQPDNVEFMGQVSGMNNQWHRISLLCITSRHEGLPLVALEALSHGIPVISFRLGALPQLIKPGYNGWTAPAGDIKSMSHLITLWGKLSETIQQQIRSNCRQSVRDNYSYEAALPKILTVYQQACEESGQLWQIPESSNKTMAIVNGD